MRPGRRGQRRSRPSTAPFCGTRHRVDRAIGRASRKSNSTWSRLPDHPTRRPRRRLHLGSTSPSAILQTGQTDTLLSLPVISDVEFERTQVPEPFAERIQDQEEVLSAIGITRRLALLAGGFGG